MSKDNIVMKELAGFKALFDKYLPMWLKEKKRYRVIVSELLSHEREVKDIDNSIEEKEKFAAFIIGMYFCEKQKPRLLMAFLDDLHANEDVRQIVDYADYLYEFILLYQINHKSMLDEFVKELEVIPDERLFHHVGSLFNCFPFFNTSEVSALGIVEYLSRTHNDPIFGESCKSVQKWAENHPNQVKSVFESISKDPSKPVFRYADSLLTGLSNSDLIQANNILSEIRNNEDLQPIYLWTEYKMAQEKKLDFEQILSDAMGYIKKNNENIVAVSVGVLIGLTKDIPAKKEEILHLLHSLLSNEKRPQVLHRLSWSLFYSPDKTLAVDFLPYFHSVEVQSKGTLDQVDWILEETIKINEDIVITFLVDWIKKHPDNISEVTILYDGTFRKLIQSPKFHIILSDWLVGKERSLFWASIQILSQFKIQSLSADTLSTWKDSQIATCVHRLHRAVKLSGEQCARLTLSLLFYVRSVSFGQLIFGDLWHFAKNYPGYTHKIWGEQMQDLPLRSKDIVEKVISQLNQYHESREIVFKFKELFPNPDRLKLIQKLENKSMAEEMEKMQNSGTSSILQMVTKVSIARGSQWFHKDKDGFSEPGTFSQISHEIEFPRMELIDPEYEALRYSKCFIETTEENQVCD